MDPATILDPMAPPSPTRMQDPSKVEEAGIIVSLNPKGAADAMFSQDIPPPEEEAHPPEAEEEEQRLSGFPEQKEKQENNKLESSSTVAAVYALQEESLDKFSQRSDPEIVVQTQETSGQEETAAVVVEKLNQVSDAMDVLTQEGVPANHDEEQQQQKQEDASSQGTELLKQEVAHRSHILGSLSKLDENSARQLLNDSGWNVSQSVRMNGKTQWYYRSPPPKPVLLGSLTSAVALWKSLVDEDQKKKGGGDDDPYPVVTSFLSNAKRPSAKKRKRGRYADR